jgi:hypothetical protein
VSAGWTLAVDREALHFLLGARGRDRLMILDGLDRLVREPHQPCDFVERSPNQRDYSVKLMGRFVVTYWLEPENIVRVVRISRIKGSLNI